MKILLIDNFDSFTYNLVDYLEQLGAVCMVVRNDKPLSYIQVLDFDAILLSPGPGVPADAGVMNEVIAFYALQKPILGVCLGHQALGQYFGASLTKAVVPKHGKISQIRCKSEKIFKNIPQIYKVVRYHSLVIQDIPAILEITAYANDATGEVMAFEHLEYPIFGIQFHPEAIQTEYGLDILRNFLKIAKRHKKKHHKK